MNNPECIACEYSGIDEETYRAHGCPECTCDDYDPTPWCHGCGAMTKDKCYCGPTAENN